MNIENLYEGQEIKNYKELCNILEIEEKTSNSQKAQISELKLYVRFTKKGHKFIIKEIYSTPVKLDYGLYKEDIQKLILNLLSKEPKINTSLKGLIDEFNIVTDKFLKCYGDIYNIDLDSPYNALEKAIGVDEIIIKDAFNKLYGKLRDSIFGAIDSLVKKEIITKLDKTLVKRRIETSEGKEEDYKTTEATEEELKYIKAIEEDSLKENNIKDKNIIYFNIGIRNKYLTTRKQMLDQINIINCYPVFDLTYVVGNKHIELGRRDLNKTTKELNKNLSEKLEESLLNKLDKTKQKIDSKVIEAKELRENKENKKILGSIRSYVSKDLEPFQKMVFENESKVKADIKKVVKSFLDTKESK